MTNYRFTYFVEVHCSAVVFNNFVPFLLYFKKGSSLCTITWRLHINVWITAGHRIFCDERWPNPYIICLSRILWITLRESCINDRIWWNFETISTHSKTSNFLYTHHNLKMVKIRFLANAISTCACKDIH